MPTLEALGVAVPGEPVPQSDVRAKAAGVLQEVAPDLLQYLKVFDTTGIATRHFVRGLDWYLEAHGWKTRSDVYREEGLRLLEEATRQALTAARLAPQEIDGIVFVSTTGIATPSLDARLVNRLGFPSRVSRIPVWGLGCAGGVAGLSLADSLTRAHPDRRYLLLSLEVCSLAFRLDELDLRSFVAATLFADGCAAAIVRGDETTGATLARTRPGTSHEWKDTERVMGWDVEDAGLSVVFSRDIPKIIEAEMRPVVDDYLLREKAAPNRYVFHPGGTKVLQAYEASLAIEPARLASSRNVLRKYGNMSSPSVLFTLADSLTQPLAQGESALLAALGPGFASELILLEG